MKYEVELSDDEAAELEVAWGRYRHGVSTVLVDKIRDRLYDDVVAKRYRRLRPGSVLKFKTVNNRLGIVGPDDCIRFWDGGYIAISELPQAMNVDYRDFEVIWQPS